MDTWGLVLVGAAVIVGLAGVIVPVLPGLLLIWAATGIWAMVEGGTVGFVFLAASTAVVVASQLVKYLVPGRQLRRAGVPTRTLAIGGVVGVLGFFVLPLVGLPLGFVAGVYLAERVRLGEHAAARATTVQAIKAVGVSILIELAAGLLVGTGWVTAVAVS